ncbi:MAG TPA: OmpH family outer membrane protein [Tepidisphaeraceae bacterium]|jgi:Skp family chaperone for outer membrane proteins|nr:OmpH family outer membrane protein [Tepidisphaeraceae bacterium]
MRFGRLNRLSLFVAIVCPLIFAVGQSLAAPAGAPAPASVPPGPTRVAIANPSRIFDQMKETKVLRDKLEVRHKELQAKEQEQRNTIDALLKRKSETNPNHPSYNEILEAIDNAKGQLQVWGVTAKASIEREQKLMLKNLYDKIEKAIGDVAQKQGIDLVMTDGRQELLNVEEIPAEELRRALNGRIILYSVKSVDLTEQVILLLDEQYTKSGSVATPAPIH